MQRGFTLIEMLLVLTLVALLASLAAPVVTGGIQRARESTLKSDLSTLRRALDDYYADTGAYPRELDELVTRRYVRRIPPDPVTEKRDTWVLVRTDADKPGQDGGILDVRSGSEERAADGTYFRDW